MSIRHQIAIPEGMQTKCFVSGENIYSGIPEILSVYFSGRTPFIIADENTWRAAGGAVAQSLADAKVTAAEPLIFPGTPRLLPEIEIAKDIAKKLEQNCVGIAVGNGVINDLVKYASSLAGCSYLCVPTAASVDGYTTSGATLMENGVKANHKCPPPLAIAADTAVLKRAPRSMLSCGYGDLFSKVTAGAEWLLADALGIEPVDPKIWDLVQTPLRENLSEPTNVDRIFRGLAATGYSMQLYHDSRPAAGSEHLFSLIWDMEQLNVNGREIPHGIQVATATLAVTKLMEFIIETPEADARKMAEGFVSREAREKEVAELLKAGCYGNAHDVAMDKFLEGDAAIQRRELIFAKWSHLGELLKKQLYSSQEVLTMMQAAGAETDYSKIGLTKERFLQTPRRAQLIRKRYMCLDVLYETGLLNTAIRTKLER